MHQPAGMHALIAAHALGTRPSVSAQDGLLMNHIPFQLDLSRGAHGTLVGHVARGNPVWQACMDAQSANEGDATAAPSIVAFQGPQACVSPNWYPSKQQDGQAVPTRNYAVVHAHGPAAADRQPTHPAARSHTAAPLAGERRTARLHRGHAGGHRGP